MNTKKCSKCSCAKPLCDFHRSKQTKDGYRYVCRTCCAQYQNTYTSKRPATLPTISSKTCASCQQTKAVAAFYKAVLSPDGYTARCIECLRLARLLRRYGILPQAYATMLARQGGVCAICHKPERYLVRGQPKALSVDHDHATGKVRGLLCVGCNRAIGFMMNAPELLRAAADYLEGSP